jgi:hypothetical protein
MGLYTFAACSTLYATAGPKTHDRIGEMHLSP